jgi:hypothetical protein
MTKKSYSWIDVIPSTFSSLLFISQIIVGIYLISDVSQIAILAYIGSGLYVFSGIVFGMLPVMEFRKKGRVKKVTFILFAIAGMLLFQHWIVFLLGIPIIPLTYIDLLRADKRLIEKFSDDYKQYMQKVPRANFVIGIIRHLQRRNRKHQTGK